MRCSINLVCVSLNSACAVFGFMSGHVTSGWVNLIFAVLNFLVVCRDLGEKTSATSVK